MNHELPGTPLEMAELALAVAREAGRVASVGFRNRPVVVEKRPNDPVTEFDVASERCIRERLGVLTPGIPVVGEEEGGVRSEAPTWYCDPIDGTTNFAAGHPFWCVSLGLLVGGEPVAGAVVAPALRDEWYGAPGFGAFRNGAGVAVGGARSIGEAVVASGFPIPGSGRPDNFEAFARIGRLARTMRRCGSAALDLCLVADGTFDAYWELTLSPWDIVAGAAIVLAAGGRVTAPDGSRCDPHRGNIVASNATVHDELLRLLGAADQ